jgi:hypothetical protein
MPKSKPAKSKTKVRGRSCGWIKEGTAYIMFRKMIRKQQRRAERMHQLPHLPSNRRKRWTSKK